ncbi:probable 2-oxoglutarate-dependent dioxygenase AOP1 [Cucurbita moschata]|uniref:Probable 2-oxoglutarate-dependent dioxygenase AOP1 n=1 Tax=Cucurbita moschata TaxID=3662 RepID=A0A6J1GPR2_CUCMO|nr:probable 2-oxoglutarate-dependent dioxygenase AOP1 [Cucurbita moschata]
MGSETQAGVPVIDLSKLEKLEAGTDAWGSTCKAMRVGLEEFGCFCVVFEEVSLELHNSFFGAVDELFQLPIETRIKNTSEKAYHGYFGRYSFLPLYESMAIDNPTQLDAAQSFANLMWPDQGNNRFSETIQRFSTLVAKLDKIVTRMVLESYGVSKQLIDTNIDSTANLLRFFKYRVPEQHETDVGLHAHTDLTFFSIIHQHLIGGLQIQSLDDQWIDLEPSSHCSFIVMAGDALMAWSNDRIRSCRHRVTMKAEETRYSAGMFSFKNGTISVPEELVDDANPLRYKPFNHYDFLTHDKAKGSKKFLYRIRDYCSI